VPPIHEQNQQAGLTAMNQDRSTINKPNIVLIMADDLGWSDLGCYGSEIRTPNLDSLASNGMKFTQMYNSARCCPSRAALLTGLNPQQAGIGHMINDLGVPAYQGYLNENCVTIAEVLKTAGYRTLMAGKWHVGGEQSGLPDGWYPDMPGYPSPRGRGFDRFYGILSGGGSYYNPNMLMDDLTRISVETTDYHFTDAIASKATQFVDDAIHRPEPFFLYMAFTAPHWPLHAWEDDIEKYRGKYLKGWDETRLNRHESQRGMGIVDPKWDISPRESAVAPWNEEAQQEWRDLQMAVYAAQVEQVDRGIGQLVDKLRESGELDNTVIMFLADNGGSAELLAEDGPTPDPSRYNYPTVDGRVVRTGNSPDIEPGPPDTFASVDIAWANVNNTPFRLFKHYTHEGGISTPFIVSWPEGVENAGTVFNNPAHIIDINATIIDIAGASYPSTFKGNDIKPHEGESFSDALSGNGWERDKPIAWEHEGNRAVRIGDWKLVSEIGDPSDPDSRAVWELYNIRDDRTELNDLINTEKERADSMIRFYNEWAERCEVEDWENPGFTLRPSLRTFSRHNHGGPVIAARLGPYRELPTP
jgi:arylsulfatase A-like enzyme